MLTVGMKRQYFLHGVPGGEVNDRGTVILNGEIPKDQCSDIKFVLEKCFV